ncbi:ABC transporter permease [Rhodopseudomonas palustris]|uniref:ABC transporter permease n=1 Tax=Rhodopseudomonas palustris TaxID=1076 RepID=A0AAX3DWK1_RHOPL|nr:MULTISPECIES: ABC transporter permease [Rhodopseudomonas]AVT78182.1 taurine ABC transporter permease [Rhodopseudomonas palustris]AVT83023.1 taurine ABC transporter permease [Rhodopseudomonas palustris]NEV79550.1 ABC transporter permease [Rhodopseudomonas sp. BR0C11]NEW95960.1 ABC transporter permease [Rhodopseudomonas sp. BR0G17]UYO39068.1 ABC transporter permease [Rhodopseudomonas palustris]
MEAEADAGRLPVETMRPRFAMIQNAFAGRPMRAAVGLTAFFAIWQAITQLNLVDGFLLPSPVAIAEALWQLALDGSLWVHLGASLQRVAVGFLLACVVGLALGLLCGWWRTVSDYVRPVIEALRPIPPLAWIPITILWFGLGDAASYFLVFLGAVFPVFIATYTAIRGLDRNQMNAALCLGAKPWQLFTDVLIPASLPIILPGLRIALGVGWMCVVTAELIAAQTGLGYLIQQSRMLFQINNVVAGMVTIGLIGFAMSAILERIERRVNAWAPSERS